MIRNFHRVNRNLFRGGMLSPKDVVMLKEKYGIEKIVSLDAEAGRRIARACKLLGIKHVMMPIDIARKSSLIKFLHHNILDLLGGEKVFVGCVEGKDRTGLAIAIYRCKHDHWSCGRALKEAVKYGFGIGVDPKVIHLYAKIIKQACGCKDEDLNLAYDVVSNQREYPSDYADYTLGAWEQQSWAPYDDFRVREFPFAPVDVDYYEEQYPSRQTYDLDDSGTFQHKHISVPTIGQTNTPTTMGNLAGISFVGSGYV
jgi:hypothetical protein